MASRIDAAYGITQVHDQGPQGQRRTIVVVDVYGTPTATHDIDYFASTFGLSTPDFSEAYRWAGLTTAPPPPPPAACPDRPPPVAPARRPQISGGPMPSPPPPT